MRKAKHAFKLQTKLGDFTHFHKGETIPPELYDEGSPYRHFIMDHTEGMILKPTHTVKLATADFPSSVVHAIPDMERLAKMPEHVVQNMEEAEARVKHTVEPTAKLMDKPIVGEAANVAPKKASKK